MHGDMHCMYLPHLSSCPSPSEDAQVTSTLCIYLEKCALIYKASLVAGTAAHRNLPQCNAMQICKCAQIYTYANMHCSAQEITAECATVLLGTAWYVYSTARSYR